PLIGKWLTVYFPGTKKISKKQAKYLHMIKKRLHLCRTITKKYKTMEKTTDIPPDRPMRLVNRTGGAA
ncbi:hypothetical protein, partial [Tannerella forsythia]